MRIKDAFRKYRKPLIDLALNTIAYAMPVLTAQVVVLPTINNHTTPDAYGYILTIVSLLSLIPHTVGNTLNNVRLIQSKKYDDNRIEGDYGIIIVLSEVLSCVAFAIGWVCYTDNKDFSHLFVLIVLCACWLLREYFIVAFRLKIDYKKICINNFLFSCGYLIGTWLYSIGVFGEYWEIIYLIAQIFSIVFVVTQSGIIKEPVRKTVLFRNTSGAYIKLLVSNFISSVGDNLDKILIFSLLGGASLSIFYAASFYTKVVSLAVTPISGVLLSYLAKKDSISKKNLIAVTGFCIIVAVIGYIACILLAKPVISLLYPEYVADALQFVSLTAVYAMLRLMYALLRPFVMKFNDLGWQIAINATAVAVFIVMGLILVPMYGISGMCISYILGGITRIALIYIAFFLPKKVKNSGELKNNE